VRANLGIVRFPDDGHGLLGLLKLADEKMYHQKGLATLVPA
jgi:hypothetical protein